MRDAYSLYQAKAKFSAIIRQVREGRSIVVTVHGEPVAEIRPIVASEGSLDTRLTALAERGILVRAKAPTPPLRRVVRRQGALERFLGDRDG